MIHEQQVLLLVRMLTPNKNRPVSKSLLYSKELKADLIKSLSFARDAYRAALNKKTADKGTMQDLLNAVKSTSRLLAREDVRDRLIRTSLNQFSDEAIEAGFDILEVQVKLFSLEPLFEAGAFNVAPGEQPKYAKRCAAGVMLNFWRKWVPNQQTARFNYGKRGGASPQARFVAEALTQIGINISPRTVGEMKPHELPWLNDPTSSE